jgi:hypothetical protein
MSSSYLNIITFLCTTLFYYLAIKPSLSYDTLIDTDKFKKYTSSTYTYLGIYVLLVIIIQFIINTSLITATCGGNVTDNIGAAGLLTFFPWTLIFGVLIIVLTVYPGFKSAFSDVVGYFYISSSANKVLTDLLIDKDVQTKMDSDAAATEEQKLGMQQAADAIIKICGNNSILINQIVPSNFNSYWSILKPLMKTKYQTESLETSDIRNKLFDLVVTRDNVGESMWFMYTGILITSIVQLKMTTRGCITNAKTMEKNYQAFLDKEDTAQQKQSLATSSQYTMAG